MNSAQFRVALNSLINWSFKRNYFAFLLIFFIFACKNLISLPCLVSDVCQQGYVLDAFQRNLVKGWILSSILLIYMIYPGLILLRGLWRHKLWMLLILWHLTNKMECVWGFSSFQTYRDGSPEVTKFCIYTPWVWIWNDQWSTSKKTVGISNFRWSTSIFGVKN